MFGRRHYFRSLKSSRYRHTVNDGNVAFEKGLQGVTHRFNCTPPRLSICVLLTHLFKIFV